MCRHYSYTYCIGVAPAQEEEAEAGRKEEGGLCKVFCLGFRV